MLLLPHDHQPSQATAGRPYEFLGYSIGKGCLSAVASQRRRKAQGQLASTAGIPPAASTFAR